MNQRTTNTTNSSANTQVLLRNWDLINFNICFTIVSSVYPFNASVIFTFTARQAGTIEESRFKTRQTRKA